MLESRPWEDVSCKCVAVRPIAHFFSAMARQIGAIDKMLVHFVIVVVCGQRNSNAKPMTTERGSSFFLTAFLHHIVFLCYRSIGRLLE